TCEGGVSGASDGGGVTSIASASLTLFLKPLMAFPSPSPNCGILPAPKMIKTMIRISTNSIHPNDPNINLSLSLLVPPTPTRSASLNQSKGGGLPHARGRLYRL